MEITTRAQAIRLVAFVEAEGTFRSLGVYPSDGEALVALRLAEDAYELGGGMERDDRILFWVGTREEIARHDLAFWYFEAPLSDDRRMNDALALEDKDRAGYEASLEDLDRLIEREEHSRGH